MSDTQTVEKRIFADVSGDVIVACTTCSGSIKWDKKDDILCSRIPEVPECVLLKLYKLAKEEHLKQKNDLANKYDYDWILNHRNAPGKLE